MKQQVSKWKEKLHGLSVKKAAGTVVKGLAGIVVVTGVSFGSLSWYFTGDVLGMFKLLRAFDVVETYYAGNISKQALLDGALKGIVSTLGDKHSEYLSGEEFEAFSSQMSASYAGIGVYISKADEGVLIAGVMDDSPASEAGLKRGDTILAIDGKPTSGMELADVSDQIRGPVDTAVVLTVREDGVDKDVSLTRRRIHIKTVAGEMVEGTDIGYIRIAMFSEDTGKEFTEQFQQLRSQGMKRFILDLRNNPGGLVDQATDVASNFVPPQTTVVSYIGSDGQETKFTAPGTEDLLPMVVLVNENSASASEIVAGDVQDLGLGKIVGVRTYGKGTVQGVYPVTADNAVKLTVAKYRTAKGRQVDGTGIEPDVVVQLQPDDTVDYQLEKALEIIKGQE